MDKIKLATVWLAGCSGCHMSFLDLDEWLFDLAAKVDVVYSPVGSDIKEYPQNVDVCLVEGAVANQENLELILKVRQNTKFLISFGDCAVTANVPAMRNMLGGTEPVLKRSYLELSDASALVPKDSQFVPELLAQVHPLHTVIDVDLFLPGCPPSAERIKEALTQCLHFVENEPLLKDKKPLMQGREMIKFG